MTLHTHLSPLLALIAGILILLVPRFLNYFVAIYLIVTGLIGLGVLRQIGGWQTRQQPLPRARWRGAWHGATAERRP